MIATVLPSGRKRSHARNWAKARRPCACIDQLAEVTGQSERLDEFVRGANIKCYRRMMAGLLDEKHRKMIEWLLKEEQAKLRIGLCDNAASGNHSREGIVP